MSQCRSFGSNYHPSSQPKKISIGIVVDQSNKAKPSNVREDDVAAVPVTRNLGSSKVNNTEVTRKYEKVKEPSKEKQTEDAVQENFPCVTRSLHQNIPYSQGVCDAKQAPSTLFDQSQRSNGANNSQQHAMQFKFTQLSTLQSKDVLHKKCSIGILGTKGQRGSSSNRVEEVLFASAQGLKVPVEEVSFATAQGLKVPVEEVSFATAQGLKVPVEEVSFATAQGLKVPVEDVAQDKAENTENKENDSLRMKIWEVLGTVSTPTKQFSNSQTIKTGSQTIKTGTDNLEPAWESDKKESSTGKPIQNSDTIESDSDSPDHTMKRPVTRSLTRKRPNKVQQRKIKNAPSSSDKHKQPEKTIFPFEGRSRRNSSAAIGCSFVSKSEKKKSSRIEPRKLHFSKRNNADETRQVSGSNKMKDHFGSSSGLKNGMGGFSGFHSKENRDSYHCPIMEAADKLGDNYELIFPKNVDEQEDVVDPSLRNIVEPQLDFNSPTRGMNSPTETYFSDSSPKNKQGKQGDVHSAMKGLNGVLNMENIRSFKSFFASKLDSDKKNKETEISDDEVVHEDSPAEKSVPNLKENIIANSPSISSSQEDASDGSESSDEGSPTEGRSDAETPEIVTAQEPKFLFRQTKRCRISEGADATIFSPSTSPQVSGKFCGHPTENEENGLARAVSLFALVLERVKDKMKSSANKRSAEILTSVAMEMQLQLQNAETQIQKDMGKLTGIGKAKRRRLETRFQEQQEQLNDIYERFRNEVNLHLQGCRSTLDGLESQQTEFKDIVEEQNATHINLLLQAEEAINTRLNDAQRRITTVQKSARQKMLQLKYVIAECLKEDSLY